MSFDERYQLLELAEDQGAKTFVAREISTGRKVTVFLFVGEQAHVQADLLTQLRAADRVQFSELLEVGDNRGTPYVVTQPIGGLSELKARVMRFKTPSPAHPESKPGEFSKAGIWHVPTSLQSTPSQTENVSREFSAGEKQQPAQTAIQSAPGSFAQMFEAPAPPMGEPAIDLPKIPPEPTVSIPPEQPDLEFSPETSQESAHPIGKSMPEAPEVPLPPKATPPPAQPAPGSFTQMFQAPAPPIGEFVPKAPEAPPPPKPAAPPAQPTPGSFTQMFQAPASPIGESMPEAPKAPSPPKSTPPPAQPAPGSFTQMFQAPAPPIGESKPEIPKTSSTQKATPPPSQLAPGEFTRFFKAASSSPAASTPMPKKPEAQGEFARIFGSGDRVTTPSSTGTGIFDQPSAAEALKQKQSGSPAAPAPPRAYAPPSGEFTRIFGSTAMESPLPDSTAQTPTPSAPQPPAGAPGEYTRMFGAQSIPQEPTVTLPSTPAKTAETPIPAKRTSKLIPVLIIAILLLLAAVAVVVVTMR